METLNIIGSIASILSFLGSLFVLNKVISIKNDVQNSANSIVVQKNNKVGHDLTGGDKNQSNE